jgi:lycopene cyclase domain-containing protein
MYLAGLSLAIACILLMDRRWKLAFWQNRRATTRAIASSVLLFALWDANGINRHIFFIGSDRYLTGIRLYNEFPLEELFFLFLLCYSALIIYRLTGKLR